MKTLGDNHSVQKSDNPFQKTRVQTAGVFFLMILVSSIFPISTFAANISSSPCPYVWKENLKLGSSNTDVLKLQQFLNRNPETAVALTGSGSVGKEGTYFGALTKQAVIKFQEKYSADILTPNGLSKGTGAVAAATRSKLNALCTGQVAGAFTSVDSSKTATTIAVETNILTVTAPAQPANTIAPANAGGVPFTNFTLTAGSEDVTVNNVTVERTGPGEDGVFYSIALNDADGNQIGMARSLNSNHKVVLGDPFVVPAHTSQTFTITGNMESDLTNYEGQAPILQIDAINTSVKVVGSLPVRGTSQNVNTTLVIGTAYTSLSSFDPTVATTRYINDTNVRFSGIRITADSQEDLSLSSIGWENSGTSGSNDVDHVVTVVHETSYPTEIDGRMFTSVFDPPIVIPKGQSLELYVQGNIKPSAVNRTIKFDIHTTDDIALLGNSFGFYVSILPEGNTGASGNSVFITSDGSPDGDSGSPFFSASPVSVSGGTFTGVGKATSN
ncbi:MAG: peptidoglycan-binding domain-containing protein [Patescibacteria group bacterium]